MKFESVDACLEHIHSSHITNFIKLAADTTSLHNVVHDVYDKVAEQIRKDTVNDNSINSMYKAATYSLELQSMFQSKRIDPVVKKHFDPSFKRKHQEEYELRAFQSRDDARRGYAWRPQMASWCWT